MWIETPDGMTNLAGLTEIDKPFDMKDGSWTVCAPGNGRTLFSGTKEQAEEFYQQARAKLLSTGLSIAQSIRLNAEVTPGELTPEIQRLLLRQQPGRVKVDPIPQSERSMRQFDQLRMDTHKLLQRGIQEATEQVIERWRALMLGAQEVVTRGYDEGSPEGDRSVSYSVLPEPVRLKLRQLLRELRELIPIRDSETAQKLYLAAVEILESRSHPAGPLKREGEAVGGPGSLNNPEWRVRHGLLPECSNCNVSNGTFCGACSDILKREADLGAESVADYGNTW